MSLKTISPSTNNSSKRATRQNKISNQQSGSSSTFDSAWKERVFRIVAPGAETVLLVGDFSKWDEAPIKMTPGGSNGVWQAKVPLAPGRHHYRFIVDGEWKNDPDQQELVPNSFGTLNNVVEIS